MLLFSFGHVIGFCFIHGCWSCTEFNDDRYLNFAPENSQRNYWPFQWIFHSNANPTKSNGQGGQGPTVQREEKDEEVWENNPVCLKEGLRRDQTPNQGPVCKANWNGSWSRPNVLHNADGGKWIWHCSIILITTSEDERWPSLLTLVLVFSLVNY